MNIKQARDYFSVGVVRGFRAVRSPMKNSRSWNLIITTVAGDFYLDTARAGEKTFLSMDTLIGEVEKITGRVSDVVINP